MEPYFFMFMQPLYEPGEPTSAIPPSANKPEHDVIAHVTRELLMKKTSVNNNDVLLALVEYLETETDPQLQHIYRQALEVVITRTQDHFQRLIK